MLVKYLATPYTIDNFTLNPGQTLTVQLPSADYTNNGLYYGFAGALLIWQSTDPTNIEVPSLILQANFTPVEGKSSLLKFNFADLLTLGQYATLPDNVFPVAMQGAGLYVVKWSPVSPYQFRRLTITVINNNPIPIVIRDGMVLYYVYAEEEKIKEPYEIIIE